MLISQQAIFLGTFFVPKYLQSNAMIDNDYTKLLPTFRAKVKSLVARMNELGYDAIMFEGFRSQERANILAKQGVGIARSMHILGLAADIVSHGRLWNADSHFWANLGNEAKKLGLTWGGDWRKKDVAHVQAAPVSSENALFAMNDSERETYIR